MVIINIDRERVCMFFIWMMVQILIESLPISSSGHVLLAEKLLPFFNVTSNFSNFWMIDFMLHGPALVIMLVYFFKQWCQMIFHTTFCWSMLLCRSTYVKIIRPALFVLIADLMTVMWWYSDIANHCFIRVHFLMIGFILTALMLYGTKFLHGQKNVTWNFYDAIILGFFQGFALLPGVSRFATTFFIGKCLGYSNNNSFALSFLIQMPLVLAAFCKGMLAVVTEPMLMRQVFDFWMLFGIVGMSFLSYQLLKIVGYVIEHNRMWYFAWYMILPIMITLSL